MNRLRVLEGLHAGAEIDLECGRYLVTGDDGCEEHERHGTKALTLLDWTHPPLELDVRDSDDGRRTVLARAGDAEDASHLHTAEPWANASPRRFGSVVLCLAQADAPWMSGAQWIEEQPDAIDKPLQPPRKDRGFLKACGMGVSMLAVMTALYGKSTMADEHNEPPTVVVGEALKKILQANGLDDLRVTQQGDSTVVRGLLQDSRQDRKTRDLIASLQGKRGITVLQQWQVASEMAAAIETAIRVPQVHVSYVGDGLFEAHGMVAQPEKVGEIISHLAAEMGPDCRGIRVALDRIPIKTNYASSIAADQVSYNELQDGAKSFGVRN
jgi:type III secretion protein D